MAELRVPVPSLEQMKSEVERLLGRSLTDAEYRFLLPRMEAERSIWLKDQKAGGIKADAPAGAYLRYINELSRGEFKETQLEERQQAFTEEAFHAFMDVIRRSVEIQEKEFATQEEQITEQKRLRDTISRMVSGLSGLDDEFIRSLGFEPVRDEKGILINIKEIPFEQFLGRLSPLEQDIFRIAKATTERQMKLMGGELPASLQKEFSRQKQELLESLTRAGVLPGSTAYNDALTKLMESQAVIADTLVQQGAGMVGQAFGLTEAVRTGKTGRVGLARAPVLEEVSALTTGVPPFFTQPGALAASISPLVQTLNTAPGIAQSFSSALQPFQFREQLDLERALAEMQAAATKKAGKYQLIGASLGLATSLLPGLKF